MFASKESESELMKDLVRELSEFNAYVREGITPYSRDESSSYHFAFKPALKTDRSSYDRNIKLLRTIYDVLDENHINIKSRGYTYLKDAICIIADRKVLDVCLLKDIYPFIAEKYGVKEVYKIEHGIRNAIDAAYRSTKEQHANDGCLIASFGRKPTNKMFLLRAAQEVNGRLLKEFSA